MVWPEHVGTRSFMLGVNLQQLRDVFVRDTNKEMPISIAPFSSLYFVKTSNVESGSIEVHKPSHITSYAIAEVNAVTPMNTADATNGTWVVESKDM